MAKVWFASGRDLKDPVFRLDDERPRSPRRAPLVLVKEPAAWELETHILLPNQWQQTLPRLKVDADLLAPRTQRQTGNHRAPNRRLAAKKSGNRALTLAALVLLAAAYAFVMTSSGLLAVALAYALA